MENRLRAWIDAHFEEYKKDLAKMVAYPSVATYDEPDTPFGADCTKMLKAFLELAKGYGFTVENIDNRCGTVTLAPGKDRTDEICVWNHLDIVPVVPEDWRLTDPFTVREVEGYLIGRGVSDNKGPAVAVLYLLRAIHELEIPLKHGLRLCVGIDEEHGMGDVIYYAANFPAPLLNIVADSGYPVCYGEKGIIEADLTTLEPMETVSELSGGTASNIVAAKAHGRIGDTVYDTIGEARHSANPYGAQNAVKELTGAMLSDEKLSERDAAAIRYFDRINSDVIGTEVGVNGSDEISGETTCVGTMIRLNEDGRATLHLNIRYIVTGDEDALCEAIRASAERNNCSAEFKMLSKPNNFPRESPVVDLLTGIYNRITGENKEAFVMGGGTYARKLPNAVAYGMGMDAPESDMFEPGHGGVHQPDEKLWLENMRRSMLIFGLSLIQADGAL